MTYDFFGAWSPTTGVNGELLLLCGNVYFALDLPTAFSVQAPLFDQDWGGEEAEGLSVDGCMRNWVKGGAVPSAINIGLPFYGRSFVGAVRLNATHDGNDKNNWFVDDGSPQ